MDEPEVEYYYKDEDGKLVSLSLEEVNLLNSQVAAESSLDFYSDDSDLSSEDEPSPVKELRKEPKKKKIVNDKRIDFDLEWDMIESALWRIIGFFLPPIVSLPLSVVFNLLLIWPLKTVWRIVFFAKQILFSICPLLISLARGLYRVPGELFRRTLSFSEVFAYRVIFHLKHFWENCSKIYDAIAYVLTNFTQIFQSIGKGFIRFGVQIQEIGFIKFVELLKKMYSSASIVLLPVRITIYNIVSLSRIGRWVYRLLASIPSRVCNFLIDSPSLVGKVSRKVARFWRRNKTDLIDVLVALAFLVVVGMVITGAFKTLFSESLGFISVVLKNVQDIKWPTGMRLPNFNYEKLCRLVPFSIPRIPFPDIALLLGWREKTLLEKLLEKVT